MPFPVKAIQIDGGAEFRGAFEAAWDPLHRITRRNPLIDAFAHRCNPDPPRDALGRMTPLQCPCRSDSADPLNPPSRVRCPESVQAFDRKVSES